MSSDIRYKCFIFIYSDFTSREAMHELIEKFFPSFDRGISNLTSNSVELLQQKKMNIHEGKSRNLRTGHLIETKPVFHLDEDGVEQPKHIVDAISERSHQPLDSEYVESIRDLYINRKREYNQKKPLPPIGKDIVFYYYFLIVKEILVQVFLCNLHFKIVVH